MAGGIRSAQERRATDRAAVVVVLATAVRDVKTAVEAIKRGAYDYITKPFDVDAIVLLVDRALEKRPSRGRCCACGRSLPFPASTTGWRAHRRSPRDAANLPGHSPSGGHTDGGAHHRRERNRQGFRSRRCRSRRCRRLSTAEGFNRERGSAAPSASIGDEGCGRPSCRQVLSA